MHHLLEDRVDFRPGHVQGLCHLAQNTCRIARTARRHHHALNGLLVGAGHQCLAQQGLAAAFRAGHHQQQLAVTGEVVQLPQHGLALCREKLETRHPRGERVMGQLEVTEERLVGMQTSHRDLINL